MIKACPCGSEQNYQDCCQPIHLSHAAAHEPEQLMRARYSAHVLGLLDFVINTYHPSCQAKQHEEAISQSLGLEWIKLEVLNSELDKKNPQQGFVEFKAFFIEKNKQSYLHERSRFVQDIEKGHALWYYLDGIFPNEKVGRNEPCPCQSGKKFKKCCG